MISCFFNYSRLFEKLERGWSSWLHRMIVLMLNNRLTSGHKPINMKFVEKPTAAGTCWRDFGSVDRFKVHHFTYRIMLRVLKRYTTASTFDKAMPWARLKCLMISHGGLGHISGRIPFLLVKYPGMTWRIDKVYSFWSFWCLRAPRSCRIEKKLCLMWITRQPTCLYTLLKSQLFDGTLGCKCRVLGRKCLVLNFHP